MFNVNRLEKYLNDIKSLRVALKSEFVNYEITTLINDYISVNIDKGSYDDWIIDFASSNEVSIKSPNGKDYFHILVTPSLSKINTLGIDYSEKDGTHIINILINIDKENHKILYTKKEVEKQIQGRNNDAQAMSNKTTIKNYIDNELRYHYEYYVESCFRLDQNFSNAYLSEVFVDMDNNAVKRIARISESEFDKDNATFTYYESDDYREQPFNDLKNIGKVSTKMELSDKKIFEEFINSSNNILSLKR